MFAWSSAQLDALTAGYFLAFVIGAFFSFASWLLACARRGGAKAGRHAARAAAPRGVAPRAGVPRTVAARVATAPKGAAPPPRSIMAPRGFRATFGRVCSPLLDTSAWAAMLCVGGGVGYLLRATGSTAPVSVLVSVPAGLAAGYLLGAMVEMLRDDTRYIAAGASPGTLATVLRRIGACTTGEVLFVHQGARRALPAASASGRPIDLGTEVVVVGFERGIARVEPVEELLEDVA
jgi:hypothetical protein